MVGMEWSFLNCCSITNIPPNTRKRKEGEVVVHNCEKGVGVDTVKDEIIVVAGG